MEVCVCVCPASQCDRTSCQTGLILWRQFSQGLLEPRDVEGADDFATVLALSTREPVKSGPEVCTGTCVAD